MDSVCDRVGILRRGVLVEVAGLADLRRLRRVENRAAVRLVRRGGVIVIIVAAGLSGLVVWQYRSLYGESFDAGSLQALTDNPAIRILFGTPVALDNAGTIATTATAGLLTPANAMRPLTWRHA